MKLLFKIAVSIIILIICLYYLDWTIIKAAINKINVSIFLFSLTCCMAHFVATAIRWQQLVYKIAKLPFLSHFKIYFYSNFLNTITPANLGGDVYRVMSLKNTSNGSFPVLLCIVKERILGLLSFLLLYLIFWGLCWFLNIMSIQDIDIFNSVGIGIAIGLPLLFIGIRIPLKSQFISCNSFTRRFKDKLSNITEAFSAEQFEDFAKLILLSFMAAFIWFATVKIIAIGLNIPIPWMILIMIAILVELVRFVPISIQGIGVREGAYAYLFALIGLSPEEGFVLGVISYFVLSLSLLLSGGISLMIVEKTNQNTSEI